MGAPIGSANGAKPRLFTDAFRKALVEDDYKRLRSIVNRIMNAADDGEPWAVQMVLERLEGKATQAVDVHVEGGLDIGVTTAELLREKLNERK